ncbi:MAG: peptidylprolyl isomerase [Burkholderiales bacterium]|jgi:cyclophilin family peptidyl-prolyl cis-trans isomerase|nr:peptidylprolyl isomerase [Burkholderiales bacterium]
MKNLLCALFLLCVGVTSVFAAENPRVTLETSKGPIKIELLPNAAPHTVENFLTYVKDGFYNGTQFHRVIDQFMIQGGGMDKLMQEKPTRASIKNEGAQNLKAGLKNTLYTVSMARRPDPDSATAQFFINVADNHFLDYPANGGYTVFGKVIEGQDVVQSIAKVKTGDRFGHQNVPLEPVMIIKASLDQPQATQR